VDQEAALGAEARVALDVVEDEEASSNEIWALQTRY